MSAAQRQSVLAPVMVCVLALGLWEAVVRINHIPHYILPAPSLVAHSR